jgi:hypothetical protein
MSWWIAFFKFKMRDGVLTLTTENYSN